MSDRVLPRATVDTCVILNVLVNGPGDPPWWNEHSTWLLEAHGTNHELFVPAIVLAELGGSPNVRGDHLPRQVRRTQVKKVHDWLSQNRIRPIDIDERVGHEAARIAPEFQLTGADAAVLAASKVWQIPTVYTWDKGLLKVGTDYLGVTVKEPKKPADAEQLF